MSPLLLALQSAAVSRKRISWSLCNMSLGLFRFRSLCKSYFRRADGAILVYDCTCEQSFINVRNWIETIQVIPCSPCNWGGEFCVVAGGRSAESPHNCLCKQNRYANCGDGGREKMHQIRGGRKVGRCKCCADILIATFAPYEKHLDYCEFWKNFPWNLLKRSGRNLNCCVFCKNTVFYTRFMGPFISKRVLKREQMSS